MRKKGSVFLHLGACLFSAYSFSFPLKPEAFLVLPERCRSAFPSHSAQASSTKLGEDLKNLEGAFGAEPALRVGAFVVKIQGGLTPVLASERARLGRFFETMIDHNAVGLGELTAQVEGGSWLRTQDIREIWIPALRLLTYTIVHPNEGARVVEQLISTDSLLNRRIALRVMEYIPVWDEMLWVRVNRLLLSISSSREGSARPLKKALILALRSQRRWTSEALTAMPAFIDNLHELNVAPQADEKPREDHELLMLTVEALVRISDRKLPLEIWKSIEPLTGTWRADLRQDLSDLFVDKLFTDHSSTNKELRQKIKIRISNNPEFIRLVTNAFST